MELKPGFKQTEVGMIPETWNVVTVGAAASNTRNAIVGGPFGSDLVSKDYVQAGVPVIRGQNMGPRWVEGTFVFVSHAKAKSLEANLAAPKDIVFTQRGTLGQVSLVPDKPYTRYLISQSQMKATLNPELADPSFVHHLFTSQPFQEMIRENAIQTGVPHINLGILRRLPLLCPPVTEQRTIATALSDVDALLASLDHLIAKKRDIKQATMQQLLTGKQRLPGFSGDWEVRRLGEISQISMGGTPSRRVQAYWGRGYPWLSIADLKEKYVFETKEEITELAAQQMSAIPKGTLVMSFKLSIGRVAFTGREMYSNEAICRFGNLKANPEYLYHTLGRVDFSQYGKQAVKGYTLNSAALASVQIPYPALSEQIAIASILSDMDNEIAALEHKRDKTRALKQGMMQELLTGRIRLV
ncbi:restriction endonuclease subunit S [Burkholderia sp. COPS]|uniref:restriction endonuclease subunit S n=1 Tax=Burkholderia sp. COPS TaxID=2597663 RepID=UPI001CA49702|nr:restriction endonuclease subunit S [Burkholderia sp. COPS]MBW5805858.1 restriction endonuclease subunit S [Burkholderia sp. COPS]